MIKSLISKTEKHLDAQNFFNIIGILILLIYCIILTLSPAVLHRSWQVDYLWSHWLGFILWAAGFLWFLHICYRQHGFNSSFLIPIVGFLCGLGILSIWRINFLFGLRQAVWFLVCIFIASQIFKHPSLLYKAKQYKYLLLFFGLFLALLTFFLGTYPSGNGPRLWLGARGIYFQPSELLKLLLILFIAAYFSDPKINLLKFNKAILPALILFSVSLALLLAQKDLGTSVIFILIFLWMLFIRYGKRHILLVGAILFLAASIISYFTIDLVRIRLQSWIQPWLDPQGGSYQIIQSIIAIAAGGIIGSGIGLGSPQVIPVAHSDFIYSAIVEETGLFGSVAILLFFALIFSRGIITAINAQSKYHQLLSAGIAVFLASQAFLIISGNIRLLPITGVTLPFLSYGGSSLLTSFLSTCILILIENQSNEERTADSLPLSTTSTLYTIFFIGFFLLAGVTSWWSFFRAGDLQLRSDNPRHFISSKYVKRGTIYDRNDNIIAHAIGEIGNYEREITYPPLSNTVGFSDLTYGNAGLEAYLDGYLSGERGYPAFDLWFNHLLYDQPLPGREVRLTIDLRIQQAADSLLDNQMGSAVVINAKSGEILAIASHPYFNANELKTNLEKWREDESSPLLNRAVQGAYPIGKLITPFLLAKSDLLTQNIDSTYLESHAGFVVDKCAIQTSDILNLQSAIINGCDSGLIAVAKSLDKLEIRNAIEQYNLTKSQDIGLPLSKEIEALEEVDWFDLLYGKNPIRVNPLQIAVVASSISADGFAPTASIVLAVNTASEGWVAMHNSQPIQIEERGISRQLNSFLNSEVITGWEVTATAKDQNGNYSWYIAGTPTNWPGTPIVVVIVLEQDNAQFAQKIGRELFRQSTQ